MKKISNETAAGIFLFIWTGFMYLGSFMYLEMDSNIGWFLFLTDTAVQITILYYNAKIERLERSLKKARQRLAEQSAEFTEYIKDDKKPGIKYFKAKTFNIKPIINVENKKRRSA